MMNFSVLFSSPKVVLTCACLGASALSLTIAQGNTIGCWKTVFQDCGPYSGINMFRTCDPGEIECGDVILNEVQKRDYADVGPGNPGRTGTNQDAGTVTVQVQLKKCVEGVCENDGGQVDKTCTERTATGGDCTGETSSS